MSAVRRPESQHRPPAGLDLSTILLTAAIAAVAVLLVASRVAGIDAHPVPSGIHTGGQLTNTLLPLVKLTGIIATVAVAGTLLTAALVSFAPQSAHPLRTSIVRRVRPWAAIWAVAALTTALLSISDIAAVSVADIATSDALLDYLWTIKQARALLGAAACALLVAAAAGIAARHRHTAAILLVVTAIGAAAPTLTGHAATAANHYVAIGSLIIHVLAVTAWVGGLFGLIVYLREEPTTLAYAVPRFSSLALACYVLVAGSGVLNAGTRLSPLTEAFSTSYGWLVLGKVLAVIVLGAMGWLHRRRTLPAVSRREPRAFVRLAVVEIIVMAATLGLAVALSQAPTP